MGQCTFSIKSKLEFLKEMKEGLKNGESISQQAQDFGLHQKTVTHWLKNEERYRAARKNHASCVWQIHPGHKSILKPIGKLLVQYIFKLCEQATPVT